MKAAGIILFAVGYTLGSWGYLLIKGYNITLREWVTPLHPFTGTLDSKGFVPPGHIFPTSSAAASGSAPAAQSAANLGPEAVGLGTDIGNFASGFAP